MRLPLQLARYLDVFVEALCVVACSVLVLVSFCQVVFRYVFNNSLVWSEELARYLFMWLIFLGAAVGVRDRVHIALDLFGSAAGPRLERFLNGFTVAAVLGFAALLIGPGWRFVRVGMDNYSPALELPMGLVYLAAPVGAALMAVYVLDPRPRRGSRRGESDGQC